MKQINLSWGNGASDLFLLADKKGIEILDYEYQHDRIHKMVGGKIYYTSQSGCSGAGYAPTLGNLVKVGAYRVDTAYNDFQWEEQIAEGVVVMLPYVSHQVDKWKTLENHPVVIKCGKNTVIYCGFYTNFEETLKAVLKGEIPEGKKLSRSFVKKDCWGKYYEEEITINFVNDFGSRSFYPWEFVTRSVLKDCVTCLPTERVHEIFKVAQLDDGQFVRTASIAGTSYAMGLCNDPCEAMTQHKGWEAAAINIMYKVRENDVYIVGWELASNAYMKVIERVARFIPSKDTLEFTTFVEENIPKQKYVEFETVVPKLLFFMEKEQQLANVRKGIAKKVREDVFYAAKQFSM